MQSSDGFYKVRLIGFEPIIFGTEIQHFIQLSHKRIFFLFTIKSMIQLQTILKVSDNSGAKSARCIKILNGFKRRFAHPGDQIVVSVQQLRNKYKFVSKVKLGDVHQALVIRTKMQTKKKDGVMLFFHDNSVSLINKQKNPVATRILGPVSKTLKSGKYLKFSAISPGFI